MIHRPYDCSELMAKLGNSVAPRSTGLHVSTLYAKLHPQKKRSGPGKGLDETDLKAYRFAGLALENIIEEAMIRVFVDRMNRDPNYHGSVSRPPEQFSMEGIACSPDLLFIEGDERIIGELKVTWMSCSDVPEEEGENEFAAKFDKYFTQIKAYCHVMGCSRGRLFVYFVNGPYRPMPKPVLLAWDLEFTQQEIEETWDALICIATEEPGGVSE